MKLTNTIRGAFISSVMNDTPSVDYSEKIRDAAVKAAVAELPPKVAALWKDKATRDYIRTTMIYVPGSESVVVPSMTSRQWSDDFEQFQKRINAACADLVAQHTAQKQAREDLQSNLRRAAYAYSTRKALATAMPEFEKYLPADEATALRTAPVIANVVSDFVKAGWPKGAKKAPEAVAL